MQKSWLRRSRKLVYLPITSPFLAWSISEIVNLTNHKSTDNKRYPWARYRWRRAHHWRTRQILVLATVYYQHSRKKLSRPAVKSLAETFDKLNVLNTLNTLSAKLANKSIKIRASKLDTLTRKMKNKEINIPPLNQSTSSVFCLPATTGTQRDEENINEFRF